MIKLDNQEEERFHPMNASNEELKEIIGPFEREWNEHIAGALQKTEYKTLGFSGMPQGEIDFMLARGAIRLHKNPYFHIRVVLPQFNIFNQQKSAMDELKYRRQKAKQYELEELEKSVPDEISVKAMFD